MNSRAALLVVALVAAAIIVYLFVGSETPQASVDVSNGPPETEEERAALEGRAPPAEVAPDETAPAAAPAKSPASQPASAPPKTDAPRVDALAEASGDAATSTLRLRVVDENGRARDDARLVMFAVEKGVGRKSFDQPIGPDGEIVVEALDPGRCAVWVYVGDFQRMAVVELAAGRVTDTAISVPQGANVHGVVRHREKGPLANIQVRLKRKDEVYADSVFSSTDTSGHYRLEGIPPGTYAVSLTGAAIGYSPRPRGTLVVRDVVDVERDFMLGEVALQGVVRDADTGRVLDGVRVGIQAPLYTSTTTDVRGAFRFQDVPPGAYTLTAAKDGFGFRFLHEVAVAAEAVTTFDIELRAAATVEFEVVDTDGKPVAGQVILSITPIDPADGTQVSTNRSTDAAGKVRYAQITPGSYDLGVSARGFEELRRKVQVESGTTTLRFQLSRKDAPTAVVLRGVVRDAETKQPIAGVGIHLQSPVRRETRTDESGVYELRDIGTATCVLYAARDGYGIRFLRGIEVEEGKTTELDIALRPAAVLHLQLSTESGEAVVGGVTLGISPVKGTHGTNIGTGVTADANGLATYRQIVPGRYTIRAIQEGSGSASIETEIREGENTVDLRLR